MRMEKKVGEFILGLNMFFFFNLTYQSLKIIHVIKLLNEWLELFDQESVVKLSNSIKNKSEKFCFDL